MTRTQPPQPYDLIFVLCKSVSGLASEGMWPQGSGARLHSPALRNAPVPTCPTPA